MLEPEIPHFIEMRRLDLEKMNIGIQNSDFDLLNCLSHRLLGTPGTFGFHYLVKLAKQIQVAVSNKDLVELKKIKAKFEYFMKCHKIIIAP